MTMKPYRTLELKADKALFGCYEKSNNNKIL